jgi:tRNA(Ile2) C34 agmatinyltransferase TiaS
METTYECRCGEKLVLKGKKQIRCGRCGQTIKLPVAYQRSKQPKVELEKREVKVTIGSVVERHFLFWKVKNKLDVKSVVRCIAPQR